MNSIKKIIEFLKENPIIIILVFFLIITLVIYNSLNNNQPQSIFTKRIDSVSGEEYFEGSTDLPKENIKNITFLGFDKLSSYGVSQNNLSAGLNQLESFFTSKEPNLKLIRLKKDSILFNNSDSISNINFNTYLDQDNVYYKVVFIEDRSNYNPDNDSEDYNPKLTVQIKDQNDKILYQHSQ